MKCLICSEEMIQRVNGNYICNPGYTKDIGHSFYKPKHYESSNGYILLYINASNIVLVSNINYVRNVNIGDLIDTEFVPQDKINFPVMCCQVSWDIISELIHKKDFLLKLEVFK